jgi:MFS family permease
VALMGGTVAGATLAGQIMMRVARYKRAAVVGLAIGTLAMLPLVIWPTSLPIAAVEAILLVVGLGLGTIFPITTTSVQNAVQPHQMGTATGVLNFARSLGGAILVAALGTIFLTLAVSGGGLASVQTVIAHGAGVDFAPVFRGVFLAAAVAIALALVFMVAMKELPLRSRH